MVDSTRCQPFIQEQSLGIHYNESNDLLDYVRDPGVFDYDKITQRINGGQNGAADRQALYARALKVLAE